MASAAEQLAANVNLGDFSKASQLKKRIWLILGGLKFYPVGTSIPVRAKEPGVLVPGLEPGQGGRDVRRGRVRPRAGLRAGAAPHPAGPVARRPRFGRGADHSVALGSDLRVDARRPWSVVPLSGSGNRASRPESAARARHPRARPP